MNLNELIANAIALRDEIGNGDVPVLMEADRVHYIEFIRLDVSIDGNNSIIIY